MVDWAGLEIRSLSQDRGFESLSLLETKRDLFGVSFCFYTLCRGLLEGTKKPNLAVELFKYLDRVEKKRADHSISSFYTL